MKFLRLILSMFSGKLWIMIFGLVLTVLSFGSSLGLLTLSTWFLAGCYLVKSMSFNIFYPSASIRGFAIARTFFKYVQRIVTHKATFDVLAKLRVQAFAAFIPLATDINKLAQLKQETEANQQQLAKLTTKPDSSSPAQEEVTSQIKSKKKLVLMSDNELFDRVIRDINNLDGFYVNVAIPLLATLIIFIIFTIGFCVISPSLGLFVGGMLILTTLTVPWIFYYRGKKLSHDIEQTATELRIKTFNHLQLSVENRIFNKSADNLAQLDEINNRLVKQQIARDRYLNITTLLLQLIMGVMVTITICGASYL